MGAPGDSVSSPPPPSCLHSQPMGSDCGYSDPETNSARGPTHAESRYRKGSSDTTEGCDLSDLRLRIACPLNIKLLGSAWSTH